MKINLVSRFLVGFYAIENVLCIFGTAEGYSLNSYDGLSNLTITPKHDGSCHGFKCQTTGECIDEDIRCDGVEDCKDGSDEFDDCKVDIRCPSYLFTCDYGACIDLDKRCNGIKECRDNSDEAKCVITQHQT